MGYPGKKNEDSASSKLTPRECRERGLTYQGALLVDLCYQVNLLLLMLRVRCLLLLVGGGCGCGLGGSGDSDAVDVAAISVFTSVTVVVDIVVAKERERQVVKLLLVELGFWHLHCLRHHVSKNGSAKQSAVCPVLQALSPLYSVG